MINLIVQEIKIIEQEYQSCQGLILSEDDLKCHLFRRIYDLIDNHNISTLDADITGSPLHTEVRFYDENGKLSLVPDITILDPAKMSIKHGVSIHIMDNKINYDNKLPSKGFEFGGKAIIIEPKLSDEVLSRPLQPIKSGTTL